MRGNKDPLVLKSYGSTDERRSLKHPRFAEDEFLENHASPLPSEVVVLARQRSCLQGNRRLAQDASSYIFWDNTIHYSL